MKRVLAGVKRRRRATARVEATHSARTGDFESPAEPPGVIVTGISRSGTSYLCNLLHRYENCVALNEPAEIISLLRRDEVPWGLPRFYSQMRSDVLAGIPIENKLWEGEVVEDTAVYQTRHIYTPKVASNEFVLAVKNTREFLLRLGAVREVMPTARIVVCVRNPFDTIASWKASFLHLREADVAPFVGHRTQMWLSNRQKRMLRKVATTRDLPARRALWWTFLADRVLEHKDDVLVVDYDELVLQPAVVLRAVLRGYRPGDLRRPLTPSAVRSKRDALDDADQQAIREICAPAADALGVWPPV